MQFQWNRLKNVLSLLPLRFLLPLCSVSQCSHLRHFYIWTVQNRSVHSSRCEKKCNNMWRSGTRHANCACMPYVCLCIRFVQTLNHECRLNTVNVVNLQLQNAIWIIVSCSTAHYVSARAVHIHFFRCVSLSIQSLFAGSVCKYSHRKCKPSWKRKYLKVYRKYSQIYQRIFLRRFLFDWSYSHSICFFSLLSSTSNRVF